MRKETRIWLAEANRDLGTAVFAMNSVDGPLPVTTGMHCQAAAEKYLKAFLQAHDGTFSRQPTLNSLLEDCMAVDPSFKIIRTDIEQLEGYSIASRYPKAADSLAFRSEAVARVERVRDFVLSKLGTK